MDPDADPDPAIYVSDLQDIMFFSKFFAYYFLKVHLLYIIFEDNSHKKSNKTVGINVFLTISA